MLTQFTNSINQTFNFYASNQRIESVHNHLRLRAKRFELSPGFGYPYKEPIEKSKMDVFKYEYYTNRSLFKDELTRCLVFHICYDVLTSETADLNLTLSELYINRIASRMANFPIDLIFKGFCPRFFSPKNFNERFYEFLEQFCHMAPWDMDDDNRFLIGFDTYCRITEVYLYNHDGVDYQEIAYLYKSAPNSLGLIHPLNKKLFQLEVHDYPQSFFYDPELNEYEPDETEHDCACSV